MASLRAYFLSPLFLAVLIAGAHLGLTSLPLVPLYFVTLIGGVLLVTLLVILWTCRFDLRSPSTWYFLGAPELFLAGTFAVALFVETNLARAFLALIAGGMVGAFLSLVATFLHTPQKYRAHAIEYVSLVLNLGSLYAWALFGFAAVLFLQLPIPALAAGFFALITFVGWGALWVSKVEGKRALWLGMIGALLVTECFSLIAFFPTTYLTSAAFVALMFYVLIGLIRAHALKKLRRVIVVRYLGIASLLALLLVLTSRWF